MTTLCDRTEREKVKEIGDTFDEIRHTMGAPSCAIVCESMKLIDFHNTQVSDQ